MTAKTIISSAVSELAFLFGSDAQSSCETSAEETTSSTREEMKKTAYWFGIALDFLHMPLVIGFLVLGRLWMPPNFHTVLVGSVVALQAKYLACPLFVFTRYLKRQKDPHYDYWGSVTFRFYHKFGPWFGIPVFIGTITVANIIKGVIV